MARIFKRLSVFLRKVGRVQIGGVQGHGTCFWSARTWYMLLGCKDMVHVVGVQGHGTCCWGARTWHVLGWKDMVHVVDVVGVQEHGTCCGASTWYMLCMLLGCKDTVHVHVVGVQGHGTCWGARTCYVLAHVGMQDCVVHSRKPCACI